MSLASTVMAPHLVDWYVDIYTNSYGSDTVYQNVIIQFNTYLKQMVNGTTFNTFTNIILSIGLCLLVFHFFTDLTEKATMKQLSTLQMGKSFCLLLIGAFVLFHTKQIFIFMLTWVEKLNDYLNMSNMGNIIVTKFLNNDIVRTLLNRTVSDYFSVWAVLGYTLTAFLLMLASLAVRIYTMYYAGTRIIELFVYYVFMPIGVSDIFENGPGGFINMQSSGFKYLKTMLAIMMQLVVVTVICQVYPTVTNAVNMWYFENQGDTTISGTGDEDTDIHDSEFAFLSKKNQAAYFPLSAFQYTFSYQKKSTVAEDGINLIADWLHKMLIGEDGEENEDTSNNKDKPNIEKKDLSDVIALNCKIKDKEEAELIMSEQGKQVVQWQFVQGRMTIETTEQFFDWCIGSDGSKIMLFILLMVTKVLLIHSSSKFCNYIIGVSI